MTQQKSNELVIEVNENKMYIIRKDYVQEVIHQPEWDSNWVKEDELSASFRRMAEVCDPYYHLHNPHYHINEEWYVKMRTGDKINLTKKQYNIIKSWFK